MLKSIGIWSTPCFGGYALILSLSQPLFTSSWLTIWRRGSAEAKAGGSGYGKLVIVSEVGCLLISCVFMAQLISLSFSSPLFTQDRSQSVSQSLVKSRETVTLIEARRAQVSVRHCWANTSRFWMQCLSVLSYSCLIPVLLVTVLVACYPFPWNLELGTVLLLNRQCKKNELPLLLFTVHCRISQSSCPSSRPAMKKSRCWFCRWMKKKFQVTCSNRSVPTAQPIRIKGTEFPRSDVLVKTWFLTVSCV